VWEVHECPAGGKLLHASRIPAHRAATCSTPFSGKDLSASAELTGRRLGSVAVRCASDARVYSQEPASAYNVVAVLTGMGYRLSAVRATVAEAVAANAEIPVQDLLVLCIVRLDCDALEADEREAVELVRKKEEKEKSAAGEKDLEAEKIKALQSQNVPHEFNTLSEGTTTYGTLNSSNLLFGHNYEVKADSRYLRSWTFLPKSNGGFTFHIKVRAYDKSANKMTGPVLHCSPVLDLSDPGYTSGDRKEFTYMFPSDVPPLEASTEYIFYVRHVSGSCEFYYHNKGDWFGISQYSSDENGSLSGLGGGNMCMKLVFGSVPGLGGSLEEAYSANPAIKRMMRVVCWPAVDQKHLLPSYSAGEAHLEDSSQNKPKEREGKVADRLTTGMNYNKWANDVGNTSATEDGLVKDEYVPKRAHSLVSVDLDSMTRADLVELSATGSSNCIVLPPASMVDTQLMDSYARSSLVQIMRNSTSQQEVAALLDVFLRPPVDNTTEQLFAYLVRTSGLNHPLVTSLADSVVAHCGRALSTALEQGKNAHAAMKELQSVAALLLEPARMHLIGMQSGIDRLASLQSTDRVMYFEITVLKKGKQKGARIGWSEYGFGSSEGEEGGKSVPLGRNKGTIGLTDTCRVFAGECDPSHSGKKKAHAKGEPWADVGASVWGDEGSVVGIGYFVSSESKSVFFTKNGHMVLRKPDGKRSRAFKGLGSFAESGAPKFATVTLAQNSGWEVAVNLGDRPFAFAEMNVLAQTHMGLTARTSGMLAPAAVSEAGIVVAAPQLEAVLAEESKEEKGGEGKKEELEPQPEPVNLVEQVQNKNNPRRARKKEVKEKKEKKSSTSQHTEDDEEGVVWHVATSARPFVGVDGAPVQAPVDTHTLFEGIAFQPCRAPSVDVALFVMRVFARLGGHKALMDATQGDTATKMLILKSIFPDVVMGLLFKAFLKQPSAPATALCRVYESIASLPVWAVVNASPVKMTSNQSELVLTLADRVHKAAGGLPLANALTSLSQTVEKLKLLEVPEKFKWYRELWDLHHHVDCIADNDAPALSEAFQQAMWQLQGGSNAKEWWCADIDDKMPKEEKREQKKQEEKKKTEKEEEEALAARRWVYLASESKRLCGKKEDDLLVAALNTMFRGEKSSSWTKGGKSNVLGLMLSTDASKKGGQEADCGLKGKEYFWTPKVAQFIAGGPLAKIPRHVLVFRAVLLACFSDTLNAQMESIPLEMGLKDPSEVNQASLFAKVVRVKNLILWPCKMSVLRSAIIRSKNFTGSREVQFNRFKALNAAEQGIMDSKFNRTLFGQLHTKLSDLIDKPNNRKKKSKKKRGKTAQTIAHYFQNKKAFDAKFMGEASEDAGGPYRGAVDFICRELQNEKVLPLFCPCPNQAGGVGRNQDKFMPNIGSSGLKHKKMFAFAGMMMANAVIAQSPLGLDLTNHVWRPLVGERVRKQDVLESDALSFNILDMFDSLASGTEEKGAELAEVRQMFDETVTQTFTTIGADRQVHAIVPHGESKRVTWDNREEFKQALLEYRVAETNAQVTAIKMGMGAVLPLAPLTLFRANELEMLVCGEPVVNIELLKRHTTYDSASRDKPHTEMFWEMLETRFTEDDRRKLLIFISGNSRLPATDEGFSDPFKIHSCESSSGNPDSYRTSVCMCVCVVVVLCCLVSLHCILPYSVCCDAFIDVFHFPLSAPTHTPTH
jgi:hypothetical protein